MPSDLFKKYDCEGGFHMLEFDLAIAAEISERITEQHEEATKKHSSSKANKAVARRNQKREQRISSKEMGNIMNEWVGE